MITLNFNSNITSAFETQENVVAFNQLLIDTANNCVKNYTVEQANKVIRDKFNQILGLATGFSAKDFRQAWRAHRPEVYNIIEDTILDKLVTGWPDDPFFMNYVEQKNLALGDKNEFYVEDNSLLQVSKFAGNHHDINLYSVRVA